MSYLKTGITIILLVIKYFDRHRLSDQNTNCCTWEK